MKKFLLPVILLTLVILSATPALAQRGGNNNNNNNNPSASATPTGTRVPLWICNSPGGTYEVALRSIVSVSTCEYIANGAAHVTEVNIDTQGNMAVRFYFIEPVTVNAPGGVGQSAIDKAQEITQELQDRSGQDVWDKVVKDYPTTTHMHTVEYRVDTKDDLMKIFTSAEAAFRTFTPDTVSVGATSENSPNTNPQ